MKIDEIKTGEPFNTLFPINPKTLSAIEENMKLEGWDDFQQIVIWLVERIHS